MHFSTAFSWKIDFFKNYITLHLRIKGVDGVHIQIMVRSIHTMGHHCLKELEAVRLATHQKKLVFMGRAVLVEAAVVAEQEVFVI